MSVKLLKTTLEPGNAGTCVHLVCGPPLTFKLYNHWSVLVILGELTPTKLFGIALVILNLVAFNEPCLKNVKKPVLLLPFPLLSLR